MCGIVGIVNQKASKTFNHNEVSLNRIFDDLLWADQLRGMDGTGIMKMNRDFKIEVLKTAGGWGAIASEKGYDKIKNWVDAAFFTVGHNRAATKGKAIAENAHPFSEGHITLVHNGTLSYFPSKYGHEEKHLDVDSKALTKMIAELGIEKAVNEFTGAYACVWFDSTDNSINFARNYERPLGYVEYDGGLVFASEPYLAAWCASRNGKTPTKMVIFDVDTHYKILADDLKNIIINKYTPTPKVYPAIGRTMYDWDDEVAYETVVTPTPPALSNNSTSKANKTKHKAKDKYSVVKQMPVEANIGYVVGDTVHLKLDGFKSNPQNSFYQISATIHEPLGEKVKHKVIGNIAASFHELSNLETIYEGRISAISMSQTGFYLINVRDIEPLPAEVEDHTKNVTRGSPKSNIIQLGTPDSKSSTELKACECCQTLFDVVELKSYTHEQKMADGGTLRRVLKVCESCEISLNIDPKLFDYAYEKKIIRLRKRGVVV